MLVRPANLLNECDNMEGIIWRTQLFSFISHYIILICFLKAIFWRLQLCEAKLKVKSFISLWAFLISISSAIYTPFVSNYSSFDFLILSLITRLIQKVMHNIKIFVVAYFINKILQKWLKFDYVCTDYMNKMAVKLGVKKVKLPVIWNGRSIA
jgi:hypothetical protein